MSKEILVLDIETTGLQTNEDLILELGMVKLNLETGEITTLFDAVFKDERLTTRTERRGFSKTGL